jgi:hypothetical protein
VSKNKNLRNIILGVAIAIGIVCIIIPFSSLFPWSAFANNEPTDVWTVASIESSNEAPADTHVESSTAYVPPATVATTLVPTTTKPKPPAATTARPVTAQPTTIVPPTTKAPAPTTKPTPSQAGSSSGGFNHADGATEAPRDGEDDPRAVLSYKMNAVDGYFYTEQEAWQRAFGFCRAYDQGAPMIFMFYDTVRFQFTYGGYDWMVQLWKGQYGWMFLGSEVGVYYLPEGRGYNPNRANKGFKQALYPAVPNEDMLNISTALFNFGEFQAKRPYKPYWWCTTFVPGTLKKNADRSQLRVELVIEMKNNEMADAFEEAVSTIGFTRSGKSYASCIKTGFDHSDVYARSGAKFAINWLLAGAPKPNTSVAY